VVPNFGLRRLRTDWTGTDEDATTKTHARELLVRKEPYQDFNLFEIIHRVIHEGLRPRLPSPSSEYPVLMLNIIQQYCPLTLL